MLAHEPIARAKEQEVEEELEKPSPLSACFALAAAA